MKRVLVIEDEAIIGIDVKESLEEFGYEVIGPIVNADEGIKAARNQKPDLVLMDIMLKSKLDGIDLATQIRTQLSMPVIFLTAHADRATLARAKVTEPYGYVLKPFKKDELRATLELAFYRYEMEQRRTATQSISQINVDEAAKNRERSLCQLLDRLNKDSQSETERSDIQSALKQHEPFNQLDESTLSAITRTCKLESFTSGSHILLEGDKISEVFLLTIGRVAILKSSSSGKDLVVELLQPYDSLSLLSAVEKAPVPFSAKAQIDSQVIWMPCNVVKFVLDSHPDVNRKLVERILERLHKSHNLSRALAHDRVEVRVASALLSLLPAQDSQRLPIVIELSRQELADMTGTAAETASRVANSMEREGLLDLSQAGKVVVLSQEGLNNFIEL